jgi:hypothetical protein
MEITLKVSGFASRSTVDSRPEFTHLDVDRELESPDMEISMTLSLRAHSRD